MQESPPQTQALHLAVRALRSADALLIGAGAGIGVDSGLPDFRGTQGFWEAYPPFRATGLSFQDLAQPGWFRRDPALAWGFYGHRLNLYRATTPHAGFDILLKWAQSKPDGGFVFTSNVDGQFQKAGFPPDRVVECHGSIHYLQCSRPCSPAIWSADATTLIIDETTFRAEPPLPHCPACGAVARPNILMFGDSGWLSDRTDVQEEALNAWLQGVRDSSVALVECGAGTAIPTVRNTMENLAHRLHAPLIRINLRESDGPPDTIKLAMGAREALRAMDAEGAGDVVIADLGVEGGGATIYGREVEGVWSFWQVGSSLFLDEDDDEDWKSWSTEPCADLINALPDIWLMMHPIKIHPSFVPWFAQHYEAYRGRLSAEDRERQEKYRHRRWQAVLLSAAITENIDHEHL